MDLSQRKVIDALHSVEKEHSCFDIRIDGAPVWEYIRGIIVLKARDVHTQNKPVNPSDNIGSSNFERLRALTAHTLSPNVSPLRIPEVDVLFAGFGRRSSYGGGKLWDPIIDPIADTIGDSLSWAFLEEPIHSASGLHYNLSDIKTDESRIYYGDCFYFLPRLIKNLPGQSYSLTASERQTLLRIGEEIDQRLNTSVKEWIVEKVERNITHRNYQLMMYECLLDRVSPHAVIYANVDDKRPLIEAAHSHGITVVEAQHGTINDLHPGFSFPENSEPVTTPSHLLSWGEAWVDSIQAPMISTSVIGHQYSDLQVQRVSGSASVEGDDQIVIISQFFNGGLLASVAIELAEAFTDDRTNVIFRPHPGVDTNFRQVYPQLQDTDVRVATSNSDDLYDLLSNARAQVGVSSTALFEGIRFGLHTYILQDYSCEYMDDLIEQGHAKPMESVENIVQDYKSQNGKQRLDTEIWFASRSKKDIRENIHRII